MRRTWGAILAAGLLSAALNCTAADFTFEGIQGKQIRLSDYRGKWVLVNFWATWCPPCREELPELVKLHQMHKDRDLVVIGVAMDETSKEKVAAFIDSHHVPYPIALADAAQAEQVGKVEVLPTSYLYDPSGSLRSYQQGIITRDSVEAYISAKSTSN
jgi:peroxiredoxin